ncbi:MAG: CHASE2 domain-containing protein, partial [Bdellovibrio sp.]|nr:CHASE2 domain-containing protein [Bdellovibrio sp.]
MKHKIWIFQIPIVFLFSAAFYVFESGGKGTLYNAFLRTNVFPTLQVLSGAFTNAKFNLRGPNAPKNKIVIVEIDIDAIAQLGRWPWHRDVTAYLVEKTFQAGAKVVGLDITFSEPDKRVSKELATLLEKNNLGHLVNKFETDHELKRTIELHQNEIVLGWSAESKCQPAYSLKGEACDLSDPEKLAVAPKNFEKFAYSQFDTPNGFEVKKSSAIFGFDLIANISLFSDAAKYAGYFDAWLDKDGFIRRTSLAMMIGNKPYPSLPLEMAKVILNDDLKITLDKNQKISQISFIKTGKEIKVSPLGVMEINFRGPANAFQYIRALQVMGDDDEIPVEKLQLTTGERKIASTSKKDLLKDAYVFIGLSALGVFDMRAFPFDHNVPGVEGHANILDNILSSDFLVNETPRFNTWWIYILMIVGALLFAYITERLESIPALLFF